MLHCTFFHRARSIGNELHVTIVVYIYMMVETRSFPCFVLEIQVFNDRYCLYT